MPLGVLRAAMIGAVLREDGPDAAAEAATTGIGLRGCRSLEPVVRLLSATIIIGAISGARSSEGSVADSRCASCC
jgi:hypothetical protein